MGPKSPDFPISLTRPLLGEGRDFCPGSTLFGLGALLGLPWAKTARRGEGPLLWTAAMPPLDGEMLTD